MNKPYFIVTSLLAVALPFAGFTGEHLVAHVPYTFPLFAKWFLFSAVGLRLLFAGLRQALLPEAAARKISGMQTEEILPVVQELGFAKLCFGLLAIFSWWKPEWRMVAAFTSGIYFGLAGLRHLVKPKVNSNERFTLWIDLLTFGLLSAFYLGR
ncbi:hypothetical protein DCC81_21465 [Chitinophaga parva]|uniref:DoxX family protein n=1 Tax=Chitinophaga parva TaxID=2169414 RepID=A0A2T7BD17_9BACT|nr:DUF6790 family protein [Chitinophaga parva]PUZ22984.1 hypothetical protein DCC81_21465 [Chitinophaga parva]